jgi:putative redox protein
MSKIQAVLNTSQPYTVDLSARGQVWRADEPPDHGGADQGPTPVEMLLGALSSCVAITVAMYASRKQWPVQKVTVSMAYRRMSPEEAAAAGSTAAVATEITTSMDLTGDLTDEQRNRLQEIGSRCPVKRSVEGDVFFRQSAPPKSADE